jgi:hypothetical protein
VLCDMLLLLRQSKQVSISTRSVVPVLSYLVKIYEDKFFNRMFDLEFPKFRVNLERVYG